jgi:hypothetical protein
MVDRGAIGERMDGCGVIGTGDGGGRETRRGSFAARTRLLPMTRFQTPIRSLNHDVITIDDRWTSRSLESSPGSVIYCV